MSMLDTLFGTKYDNESFLFVCTFALLGKLAAADGRVSEEEVETVDRIIEEYLKLDEELTDRARQIFCEAQKSSNTFEEYAQGLFDSMPQGLPFADSIIEILLQVSAADGEISQSEEEMIRRVADILACKEGAFNQLRSMCLGEAVNSQGTPWYYAILECSQQSTDDELIISYHRLMRKYDPRKVVLEGYPEDFIAFIEEKRSRIRQAFEVLRSKRMLADDPEFFRLAFVLFGSFARSGGRSLEREDSAVSRFIDEFLSCDESRRERARQLAAFAYYSSNSFEYNIAALFPYRESEIAYADLLLDMLLLLVSLEGGANAEEDRLLEYAAKELGVNNYSHMRASYLGAGQEGAFKRRAFSLLGLTDDAGKEEIERAYASLSNRYSIERLAGAGVSEEFWIFVQKKRDDFEEARAIATENVAP